MTSSRQVDAADCLPSSLSSSPDDAQLKVLHCFAAGEWEAAGEDKFFSRSELYSMAWSGMSLKSLRSDTRLKPLAGF